MQFDLILRQAQLGGPDGSLLDIAVRDGRVAAIGPTLPADGPEEQVSGRLVLPGLVETHIHLDKSCLLGRCVCQKGTLDEAVGLVAAAKRDFTDEDVYARASRTLERALLHGTMRMRTHVEVDPRIGLTSLRALLRLKREYAWAIDIEICVFPQEGLTNNPGTDELLVAALRDGATVVGAAPAYDTDHAAQIRRIFALGREFDVDIDMHLDFGNSPEGMDIHLVCDLTEQYRLGGRVTVGHATMLSTMKLPDLKALARRIGDAGVAVTVLPATDLFLMGRDQTDNIRRGLADVNLLAAHGVTCSLSTNNVLNPFTPFGDCSLVRMGNLQANVCQIGEAGGLREIFAMLTERSAKLMNLPDYGLKIGNPADIVVVDATSPEQAIAEISPPLAAFKRGRRTLTRARPQLHAPEPHALAGATP